MNERNNHLLKLLDKYIGIPLNFCLGLLRIKKQKVPAEIRRVVLLKTAAIGDTILLEAVIREIKHQFPQCEVTLVCSKSNLVMAKLLPDVEHIYLFDMSSPFKSLWSIKKLGIFDVLLDFAPWARINSVIAYFIQADYKVGFKRKGMQRHYVYDAAVEHLDSLHEMDNYRNLLRAATFKIKAFDPCLKRNNVIQLNCGSIGFPERFIIFHPYPGGSSQLLRYWDEKNWIVLGKKLYERHRIQILISGGKEDFQAAEALVEQFINEGVNCKNIAGKVSLGELIDVLPKAAALVSVNTGIMHLGAAVGVKMVALHGATSSQRWGPLSQNAIVVQSGEACQPCISLGFESKCKDPVCMKNISPERVLCEFEKLKVFSKDI